MSEMDREKLGELLSAFLDDELDASEARLVERVLHDNESARRLLDELRRTATLVSSLPRHDAPKSIADDVRAQVERSDLLGDLDASPTAPLGRQSRMLGLLSMAAMLALVVGGGLWITLSNRDPAAAIRSQVAMVQPDDENAQPAPAGESGASKTGKVARRSARRSATGTGERRKDSLTQKTLGKGGRRRSSRRHRPETEAIVAYDPASHRRGSGRMDHPDVEETAGVEQKLAAGMDAGRLRDHRFANESVRLQLTMRNESEREEVTTKLVEYFKKQRLVDVARSRVDLREHRGSPGSFFYLGKPGVNFDDAQQRQILLRVPRRELDGLLAQMEDEGELTEEVALVSGPVVVDGLDEARNVLRYRYHEPRYTGSSRRVRTFEETLTRPSPRVEAVSHEDADSDRTESLGELLTEMAEAVGLGADRERFPDYAPVDKLDTAAAEPPLPESADEHDSMALTDKGPDALDRGAFAATSKERSAPPPGSRTGQGRSDSSTAPAQGGAPQNGQFSLFEVKPMTPVADAVGAGVAPLMHAREGFARREEKRKVKGAQPTRLGERRSLADSRWAATQDASRRRANAQQSKAQSSERELRGATRRAGAGGSGDDYVTLVVELLIASPSTAPVYTKRRDVPRPAPNARPSDPSRPSNSARKAKKTRRSDQPPRMPQE